MNEAKEQITFDPGVEHPEPSGVPQDLNVELPFPMLIATVNNHAILVKIQKNEFFTISIVDLNQKTGNEPVKPLKMANIRFGATPPNVEVGAYWHCAITTSAQAFYAMFQYEQSQRIAVPQKPSLAVIHGGQVKVS